MEPLMGIIGLVIIIGICAIIDSYNKRAKKEKRIYFYKSIRKNFYNNSYIINIYSSWYSNFNGFNGNLCFTCSNYIYYCNFNICKYVI